MLPCARHQQRRRVGLLKRCPHPKLNAWQRNAGINANAWIAQLTAVTAKSPMLLPLTPVRFKKHASELFGRKTGVVCGDERFTYDDLN